MIKKIILFISFPRGSHIQQFQLILLEFPSIFLSNMLVVLVFDFSLCSLSMFYPQPIPNSFYSPFFQYSHFGCISIQCLHYLYDQIDHCLQLNRVLLYGLFSYLFSIQNFLFSLELTIISVFSLSFNLPLFLCTYS